MLLTTLCLIVASVPLFGGRLGALAGLRPRLPWLLFGALALQVAARTAPVPERAALAANLATYLLGGLYLLANIALPGLWLVLVGAGANTVAMAANGGVMPATPAALEAAGLADTVASAALARPNLAFLGDVFALPVPPPLGNVFSVGDVVILVGCFVTIHRTTGSRLLPEASGDGRGLVDNAQFRALWTAQAAGWLGAWTATVGAVAATDGSFSSVSALLATYVLTLTLTAVVAGPLVERAPRPSVLSAAAAARCIAVLVLLVGGSPGQPRLVLAALVAGLADAAARPALRALVPDVVPPARLLAANGVLLATFAILGGLAAGLASGAVRDVGPGSLLLLGLAASIGSAALFSVMATPRRPSAPGASTLWEDLTSATTAVVESTALSATLLIVGLIALVVGIAGPEPFALLGIVHRRVFALPVSAGMLVAGASLGGLGTMALGSWPRRRIVWRALAISGTASLFAGAGWPLLPFWLVAGMGLGLAVASIETLLQQLAPPSLRGRVVSFAVAVSGVSFVAGHTVGRWLGDDPTAMRWLRAGALVTVGAVARVTLRAPSVPEMRVDETDQGLPVAESPDVVLDAPAEGSDRHLGSVAGVGRDDAVPESPERVVVGKRLGVGDVEPGTADDTVAQGADEVVGDDVGATGDVDEPRVVLHGLELAEADDAGGLGSEGERQHDEVRATQGVVQSVGTDGACRTCQWLGIAADDCCLHTERRDQLQQGLTDPAATQHGEATVIEAPAGRGAP